MIHVVKSAIRGERIINQAVCFLAIGLQKKCVLRRGFLLFGVTLGTLLFGTEPIKAGDIWDGYVQINGTWYNVGGANNKQYSSNTGGAQDLNRTLFNNNNFGTVNYGAFGISGFSVMGWTGFGENVGGGGLNYKIWKNGTTEPTYSNYFNVNGGNYAFGNNNYNQNSTSQVAQLIGADWINGDTYSLKTQSYTTINSAVKFYEATATLVINGARQLINSNSDTTQSSAYNTSSTGGLVKQGTGTLTLAVDNSNSTTGQKGEIYIDAGTIAVNAGTGISGNNALGGSTTVVRLGGESGTSNAGFALANNGGLDVGRTIVVRSGSSGTKTISSSNSSGVNTLSGVIALDDNVTISGASGTGELNISGAISDGAGAGNYGARFSAGTVRLSGGVSNTGITLYTVASGVTLHLAKSNADAVQSILTIDNGGTVNFSASNQLGDSTVVNNNGTLAIGNNSDTFNTLNSSGNITGSGTLTAATYALNGGTVSANLGAGTVNASSGTTSLSGTSAAANVNVSGGLLSLANANRLADTAAVAVSSGTLGMAGNDTIGSLSTTGGTVSGTGTLTAATYALNGGTVSVDLGAGTVNASSGTTSLSGTSAAANVNVSGGLLSLANANRLADTAAVAVSSGTLGMAGNDTIGSLSTTGGTVSGTGTLTAATYALNGGTVSVNLGAGTVNASSGTTSLSGTSAAANVNVSGGLLSLASVNRLADTAAVAVSNGELVMGGDDIIGSLSTTGGTVSGTGTLTAATYALNGGTVSVNLGAGTVNASSGTTSLSGTSAAANVNVQGGTLNTSSANRLADGASVAVSSGTLGVGGNDTVGSLAASGTGVVTIASNRTLTANGNSSITGSARATGGIVAIANNSLLNLANSSTTTTSDLSIGSGSTLVGTGGTSGQIKGSGLLSPGNSPGILTSGSVDLTGGIDFAFEFTAAGAPTYSLAGNSKNDLLHLTSGSAPFSGSFSTGNTVSFYFNDAGLSASLASVTPTTYLGGFFVDTQNFNIAGLLSNATKQYFIAAAGGSTSFNGVSYNLMSDEVASRIILSNVNQSGADFTTGTVNGTVLGVMAVPEPSSGSLLLAGIGSLLVLRRFRKKA